MKDNENIFTLMQELNRLDKQIMKDLCEIIDEYGLIRLNVLLKDHGYKILKIED
jgi:hypothetical protein